MNGVGRIVTDVISILGAFADWDWERPLALALLVVVAVAAWRVRRTRQTLDHPESWLFQSGTYARLIGAILRWVMIVSAGVSLAALALYFSQPVLRRVEKKTAEGTVVIQSSVDVSGSMQCKEETIPGYFGELFRQNQALRNAGFGGAAFGVYYFSSRNLLEIFPTTNTERLASVVRRFGPGCNPSRFRGSAPQGYGAGENTEPGPSLWQAIADLALYEDPQLFRSLVAIHDAHGFRGDANPVRLFLDVSSAERLCRAMRGKRLAFVSDMEFLMTNGDIAPSKMFELAAAICLPIDIIILGAGYADNENALEVLVGKTGGSVYRFPVEFSRERARETAASILAAARKSAPSRRTDVVPIEDRRPQRLLLAIALASAILWAMIRSFRVIVDW